jgi:TetR/AcrR family transcriptional regulator, transcriptional repressor for nem operon
MSLATRGVRPRKLTRKGLATRERIVAAAAELIFERGVAETTTQNVCDAAGVSFSQLYHYFDDKMKLVRAVIAHQTDAVLGAQRKFLGNLDSIGALRAWRNHLVAIQHAMGCEGGCPLGSLSSELSEKSTDARADLATGFERWEEGIRSGLRAMHARELLPAETDPDKLALAMLAALQGGLALTQLRRQTAPLEAALDTMIDYLESLTQRRQQMFELAPRRPKMKTST